MSGGFSPEKVFWFCYDPIQNQIIYLCLPLHILASYVKKRAFGLFISVGKFTYKFFQNRKS